MRVGVLGRVTVFIPGDSTTEKKILEEGQPNTNYKAFDWTEIAHTCRWLVVEDVNHLEISCSRLQNIYTISLFFTDNVIFEHQLLSGIIFKIR